MKELRKVLKSMGEKVSQKQVKQMMKFADRNGDGLIDFEGKIYFFFLLILTSSYFKWAFNVFDIITSLFDEMLSRKNDVIRSILNDFIQFHFDRCFLENQWKSNYLFKASFFNLLKNFFPRIQESCKRRVVIIPDNLIGWHYIWRVMIGLYGIGSNQPIRREIQEKQPIKIKDEQFWTNQNQGYISINLYVRFWNEDNFIFLWMSSF